MPEASSTERCLVVATQQSWTTGRAQTWSGSWIADSFLLEDGVTGAVLTPRHAAWRASDSIGPASMLEDGKTGPVTAGLNPMP
eukprot:1123516-Rhodomonas_salina.1